METNQLPLLTERVFAEPEPDILMPRVSRQPPLKQHRRGKLTNVESLIAYAHRHQHRLSNAEAGRHYQLIFDEFQPLIQWADRSWDFLLSSEGCRFIPRAERQRTYVRGDYRAFIQRDYQKLIYRVFRACIVEFAEDPHIPAFGDWIAGRFWQAILEAYHRMLFPEDPDQRPLTPYSYLRCSPYHFLNEHHHVRVGDRLCGLPSRQRLAIETYFLEFRTATATALTLKEPPENAQRILKRALAALCRKDYLVYCLLRQIERY